MKNKIKNLSFVLNRWKNEGGALGPVHGALYVIAKVTSTVLAVYIASWVILCIENGKSIEATLGKVILIISLFAVVNCLKGYSEIKLYMSVFIHRVTDIPKVLVKIIKLPYQYTEGSQGKLDFEKASDAVARGNETGTEAAIKYFIFLIADVISFLILTAVSAKLSIVIMIVLVGTGFLKGRADHRNRKWIKNNKDKKNSYYAERIYLHRKCLDSSLGKDIRIYDIQNWFKDKALRVSKKLMGYFIDVENKKLKANIIESTAGMVRDIVCYGYLIYRVANGMAISDFVLYITLISGFNRWISGILENYSKVCENLDIVDSFRIYMEKEEFGCGEYEEEIPESEGYTYEFKNVSFGYENKPKLFKDFNLTIKSGEKVALVGENGAGKTTLVNLMSGLYKPDSGEILLNGVDISKVNPKKLLEITSIVFQESKVFADTIEKNISLKTQENTDEEMVRTVLEKADIKERIDKLSLKEKTQLTKAIDDKGIELSGGEYQKIMFARALYKNSPVLILDEPTAALDPIGESNMYLHYNEICKGKTAVFISHRLSSTRFCHRVIFLRNGEIVQDGKHDELIKENGPYREMFEAQAHYYQEDLAV